MSAPCAAPRIAPQIEPVESLEAETIFTGEVEYTHRFDDVTGLTEPLGEVTTHRVVVFYN